MLPSRERLTRSSLFQRAYNGRKSISTPLVTLYVLPRTKPSGGKSVGAVSKHSENPSEIKVKPQPAAKMPLVGFVVAKKVCKSACARNRIKRRLREAYRILRTSQTMTDISLSQWYALVWVVHEKGLDATWTDIQSLVVDCLNRANSRFGAGSQGAKGKQGIAQAKPVTAQTKPGTPAGNPETAPKKTL